MKLLLTKEAETNKTKMSKRKKTSSDIAEDALTIKRVRGDAGGGSGSSRWRHIRRYFAMSFVFNPHANPLNSAHQKEHTL
jgi:hypothetical protein